MAILGRLRRALFVVPKSRSSAAILARCAALLALLAFAGCKREAPPAPAPIAQAPPQEPRLGQPQIGLASFYGRAFTGKRTASGDRYDPDEMTAAHRTLPLGSIAKVTNTDTGWSIQVEVNDRGPYAHGRILDLSRKAAASLGILDAGVARVKVEAVLAPAGGR